MKVLLLTFVLSIILQVVSGAACTGFTTTYSFHFTEWNTDSVEHFTFPSSLQTTVTVKQMTPGFIPRLRVSVTAETQEAALGYSLNTTAEDGVLVGAAFGETASEDSSATGLTPFKTTMTMTGVAGLVATNKIGWKGALAMTIAALSLGAYAEETGCQRVAQVFLELAPTEYNTTVAAILRGDISVTGATLGYDNGDSASIQDSCSDPVVAANFPLSCQDQQINVELQPAQPVQTQKLFLSDVFTFYNVNFTHQKCSLDNLQKAIRLNNYYRTFSCQFRNQVPDGTYCGSEIILTNVAAAYKPSTSPHQKTAVDNLQIALEKETNIWTTFVSNWRKEKICVSWVIRSDGRCGANFNNSGCNPEHNFCCSPFGWCGIEDVHCSGGIDYRKVYDYSVPAKDPVQSGQSVTLTGKKCSGNHPLTSRPGVCIESSKCTQVGGTTQSGLCPYDGPSVLCCDGVGFTLKQPVTLSGKQCSGNHPLTGRPGVCIESSQCTQVGGTTRSGLCPNDPGSVLCCDGEGFDLQFPTSSGLCGDYAGRETFQIRGNDNVVYTVVKILPAHLVDPSAFNSAPNQRDNTMEVATACAFSKMRNAALTAGVNIRIASGFRTLERQQYFYNCYKCRCCNGGNLAAVPGTSNHGKGIALDVNTDCGRQSGSRPSCGGSAVYQWLYNNAQTYGFVRTVQSEPWHWEYRPGQSRSWFS